MSSQSIGIHTSMVGTYGEAPGEETLGLFIGKGEEGIGTIVVVGG
jgi:hypothetical protein